MTKGAARPPAGAYAPLVPIGSPSGKPDLKPRFRVLLHKGDWKIWQDAIERAGAQNIKELWDHLAYRPDHPPLLGTVTRLRGKHLSGSQGWSAVHHYELTGAARVDYQFNPAYVGLEGDPHGVVKIIRITLSSH